MLSTFIISGCSELSKSETQTTKKFERILPQLQKRYTKLFDALNLAVEIGGQRDITKDGLKSYSEYLDAVKKKNTSKQLDSAIDLEDIIGRLRANASSVGSVKLSGSQELKDAIGLIDKETIAKDVKDKYTKASKSYEEKRTSWRYLLSATICGYSSQKILEFSEPS